MHGGLSEMDTDERTIGTAGRGIGRRTVVKGAVATAWTAPLVQVIAAPAFAAVSGPANLSGSTATFTAPTSKTYRVQALVKNSGGAPTTGLSATVSWVPQKVKGGAALAGTTTPVGWTRNGTSYSFAAKTAVAAGASQPFDITVTMDKSNANGTLTVSFSASGTAGSVSKTY